MAKLSKTAKYTFHILYRTINLLNGKVYIGVHSTTNPLDGYVGCGIYSQAHARGSKKFGLKSVLIDAVCKYGYENFLTEPIAFFHSREALLNAERNVVNEAFIKQPYTYNLTKGGNGGTISPLSPHHEEIHTKFMQGRTLKELCMEYGVGITLIRKIVRKYDTSGRVIIPLREKKLGSSKDQLVQDYLAGKSLEALSYEHRATRETIRKMLGVIARPEIVIIGVSPTKEIFKFTHTPSFAEKHKLNRKCIWKVLNGDVTHHQGWHFFEESKWNGETTIQPKVANGLFKDTLLLNPRGEIVRVEPNLNQFCKNNGLIYWMVSDLIKGKTNQYKNWKRHEEICPVLCFSS